MINILKTNTTIGPIQDIKNYCNTCKKKDESRLRCTEFDKIPDDFISMSRLCDRYVEKTIHK